MGRAIECGGTADAETRLIRLRVTLAFVAVMTIVLGAIGVFVYLRFGAELDHATNSGLRSRAGDVAALFKEVDSGLSERHPSKLRRPGRELRRGAQRKRHGARRHAPAARTRAAQPSRAAPGPALADPARTESRARAAGRCAPACHAPPHQCPARRGRGGHVDGAADRLTRRSLAACCCSAGRSRCCSHRSRPTVSRQRRCARWMRCAPVRPRSPPRCPIVAFRFRQRR